MNGLGELKRMVNSYLLFSLITSLLGTGFAIILTFKNPYAAFPWYLSNLMTLSFALVGILGTRSLNDPLKYGSIVIECAWWILSVGFGGVLFYIAPFFMEIGGILSWIMFVISLIWLLWGIYVVIVVHKETKAPIAP